MIEYERKLWALYPIFWEFLLIQESRHNFSLNQIILGAAKFVSFSHYQNLKPLHNIISRNLMSSPLFISPSKVTERKGNFKVLYRGALYTYLHVLFDQYAFEQYVLKMNSSMQWIYSKAISLIFLAKKTHLRNQRDNDGGGKGSTNSKAKTSWH